MLEVTPDLVKYRRTDNPDGPLISVRKADVFRIRYANGTQELLAAPAAGLPPASAPTTSVLPGDADGPEPVHLSGPRLGFTVLSGGVLDRVHEHVPDLNPFLTQFGWQFESRLFRTLNGVSGLERFPGQCTRIFADMKAYSQALRERVLAARQAGAIEAAVAAQCSVSVSFVTKLTHRQRTHGTVAARPGGRGPAPRLHAPALTHLRDCLHQTPAATLDELRGWLAALGGSAVSRSALGRAVQGLDWRRKKSVSTPLNATPSA